MQRRLSQLFDRYRRRGDVGALAEVFDRTAPRLTALAHRLRKPGVDPDDLVQETFLVAIEQVPAAYREVLELHLEKDYSPTEIAIQLQRPAATVRVQLHRSLAHMRRLLPLGIANDALGQPRVQVAQAVRSAVIQRAAAASPLPRAQCALLTLEGVAMSKLSWVALGAVIIVLGTFSLVRGSGDPRSEPGSAQSPSQDELAYPVEHSTELDTTLSSPTDVADREPVGERLVEDQHGLSSTGR